MSDEKLTFPIGTGSEITVRSYPELLRWMDNERAKWSWLNPGDEDANRHNVAASVQIGWDQLFAEVTQQFNTGQPMFQALGALGRLTGGHLLVSTTADGALIIDILRSNGVRTAAFAFGFLTQMVAVSAAQSREDFLGALLTVAPNLKNPTDDFEYLKRERVNFRNATRSLIERVDREAEDRQREQRELFHRASKAGRRLFDRKRQHWHRAQSEWQEGATGAVEAIQGTDATYNQFMQLKAPVQYWTNKATEHGKKEKTARRTLYAYFPLTIAGIGFAFWRTGEYLIAHPPYNAAVYVVISGGLLLLSTMLFWVGRLLTKLYLSEHHLRNDAEERSVMTETYLAMTNGGAADEKDRHIVLTALFRNTPDGIVKDDGPTDASIQGLITRFAMR